MGLFSFTKLLVFAVVIAACRASNFDCTFDQGQSGWCDYYNDDTADFDWSRQNGTTSTVGAIGTGPEVDHTTGTTQGNYLYADAASQTKGDKARIISHANLADTPTPQCVQFYYFMRGAEVGSLKVYARVSPSQDLGDALYEKTGHQGMQWYRGLVSIVQKSAELVFEAEIGSGPMSDIAIDDIEVIDEFASCPVEMFSCDFDLNLGGMVQDKQDDFDFVRKRGKTSSLETGPENDHTTGNGYYVYIEASGPSKGHKARLITPQFRGVQGNDAESFCVIFWYHMFGSSVGELSVFLRNASSTDLGSPIWWLGGNRGNLWRAGEAEIKTPEDFWIYFEAMRGQSYDSDIALDDIQITSYGCPGHHIINNVSSVSCGFEEVEICYWQQDKTDDFDWSWRNRGTRDGFTGPDVDHTRGDELGFFLFVTSTYRLSPTDKARLISPMTKSNTKSSCVEFWYHMWGRDVETLNVYIKPDQGSLPASPVWSQTGDKGNYWHRQTITVQANSGDYRLVFEGSPGEALRDDIAIDDVTLYEGADCPGFTTLPPPTTKAPVLADSIDCNFDEDFCGYEQMMTGDQMDWFRYTLMGPNGNTYTGPQKDHTTGTGFYAVLNPYVYTGAALDDNAILVSPLIAGSGQARCLTFYACMHGYSVDYLNLYIVPRGETRPLDPPFSVYGEHGEDWFLLQMDIPASTQNFQVMFEAICGRSRYSSKIAVDDIKLINGKCQNTGPTPEPVPWGADCDFEKDGTLCGYTQYPYDKFEWTRHSGGTGSEDTGPRVDHTLGTDKGHYMYIETSIPTRPDYSAILLSPILNSRGEDICLRFYYHAYGGDVGILLVKLDLPDLNIKNNLLFSVGGNQGDEWRPANINMPYTMLGMANYQIKFEGLKGSGYYGDIAIDDIKFLAQPCEGFPSESRCNFEQGTTYCGYRDGLSLDYKWKWFDALATEDSPLNTIGSSFMYVEGSGLTRGAQSVLYSQTHDLLGVAHCFTIDFVMTGDGAQQVKIEAIEHENSRRHSIHTLSGDMGQAWTRGNWTLPSDLTKKAFQIIFTATRGSAGVMAIDNVILSTQLEACAQYVPPPTEPPTTTTPTQTTAGQKPSSSPIPTTKPDTTKNPGASRTPQTGSGPVTGTIVGATVGALVAIVVIIIVVIVYKWRMSPGRTFNLSYKNEQLDEIPFSGFKAETGGMANPTVISPSGTN